MPYLKFNLDDLPKIKTEALCIGKFDGFHKGHIHIINRTKALASGSAAVLTFSPLPFVFFKKGTQVIYTDSEKSQIVKELGIDYLLVLDFNESLAKTRGEDFLAKISGITKNIVVGKGFRFGAAQACGEEDLLVLQSKYGYNAHILENVTNDNTHKISSMALRQNILSGNFEEYACISPIPFFVSGIVHKGAHIAGRSLGFPTANLHIPKEKIMPEYGVYATQTTYEGATYPSISNYGIKPTVSNINEPVFETHILNYNEDLYGKEIKVTFLKKIRAEQKFDDINRLKFQIIRDIETCKTIHGL